MFVDCFLAVHIWAEWFWYCYRAVGVLVKLKKGDEYSRRGDYGIVECMAEVVLLCGCVFVAEVHSSGLEFVEFACAVGFAIVAARGHPGLDVEFFHLASAEVAGADICNPVGQLQGLHHSLGVG